MAPFGVNGNDDTVAHLTSISAVGQDGAGDRISLWLNDGDGSAFNEQSISTTG